MVEKNLTQEELDERVAVLTRLRKLLVEQRQKFRNYLEVLEKQEQIFSDKKAPETEKLIAHTELEQEIVGNIQNLQKVITPLETMCKETDSAEIPELKADLTKLQNQVLSQNNKNRELLKSHINIIRSQVQGYKNPYKNKKSIYANKTKSATRISIEC